MRVSQNAVYPTALDGVPCFWATSYVYSNDKRRIITMARLIRMIRNDKGYKNDKIGKNGKNFKNDKSNKNKDKDVRMINE